MQHFNFVNWRIEEFVFDVTNGSVENVNATPKRIFAHFVRVRQNSKLNSKMMEFRDLSEQDKNH